MLGLSKTLNLTSEQTILMRVLWRTVRARELSCRYQKENPDKVNANHRKWIKAHPGIYAKQGRVRSRLWRIKNPGAAREQVLKWAKNNPERLKELKRATNHKRKALKRGNGGSYTANQWVNLKKLYNNRCICCGKTEAELECLGRIIVPDHVLSIINGGTNNIDNIQPLCHGKGGCNNKKSTKHIDYR